MERFVWNFIGGPFDGRVDDSEKGDRQAIERYAVSKGKLGHSFRFATPKQLADFGTVSANEKGELNQVQHSFDSPWVVYTISHVSPDGTIFTLTFNRYA